MTTLAAGPFCRLAGVPLIDGTIQTGALLHPEYQWLKRIGMACATRIVANTRAGLRAWGVGPAKGRVVYNGFDWSRLASCADETKGGERHSQDDGCLFTVVMAGRMVPARDYRTVISAARLLRDRGRPCRFILIGQGPMRDECIAEASDLVADAIVEFPPPGIEILPFIRQAHVGVLMADPQWAMEGCSNAIMEYMACGLPAVCGDGGGNPELVVDGTTGFVIPPADPVALAGHIEYLRDHEDERRAMGEAGRQRILTSFTVERMIDAFVRIYEEALLAREAPCAS